MSASNPRQKRVVVIGGGIAGLACAHRLQELFLSTAESLRPSVLLVESGNRLGGVIQTIRENGSVWECGPDSFITQKPAGINLCQRLGLSERLINTNEQFRRAFIAFRGKLHPVPEGFSMMAPAQWWPFVLSPLFSPIGKMRVAMDLVLPKRKDIGDESLAEFVERRLGREALERVAQPLLGGVYTADPTKLSLRATMPRFLDLESKYGSVIKGLMVEQKGNPGSRKESGARYGTFVSLDDGLQVLVDTLAAKLPAAAKQLNTAVLQVVRNSQDSSWDVVLKSGQRLAADFVVLATSGQIASGLVADADPTLSSQLATVESAGSVVVNLTYDRADISHSLDGFGFVVPAIEPSSLIACSFSSVKFAGRAPAGMVQLRAFLGGALNPHISELDDGELLKSTQRDLRRYLGVSVEPTFKLVSRWSRSMPQYQVGHLDLVAKIESRLNSLNGLYVAGNAYRGVGIPDCIASGEQAAESIYKLFTGLGTSQPGNTV